jgi:hypothetical protein
MSGPIVRKYGFPNFDQIFGKRELQHGSDEPDSPAESKDNAPTSVEKTKDVQPPGKVEKDKA